ncbi:hypothetical protein GCM10007890_54900 [Methylobacterium tardum]|uniref:Uncharacterized protein n=1 Tax=Methylobacterium tardum TaxID=374432 RepID=A0AA37TH11_9HYPH|nr:hypothetical protein GCM10007890_54900 [Methylobacterium tardum]
MRRSFEHFRENLGAPFDRADACLRRCSAQAYRVVAVTLHCWRNSLSVAIIDRLIEKFLFAYVSLLSVYGAGWGWYGACKEWRGPLYSRPLVSAADEDAAGFLLRASGLEGSERFV